MHPFQPSLRSGGNPACLMLSPFLTSYSNSFPGGISPWCIEIVIFELEIFSFMIWIFLLFLDLLHSTSESGCYRESGKPLVQIKGSVITLQFFSMRVYASTLTSLLIVPL